MGEDTGDNQLAQAASHIQQGGSVVRRPSLGVAQHWEEVQNREGLEQQQWRSQAPAQAPQHVVEWSTRVRPNEINEIEMYGTRN